MWIDAAQQRAQDLAVVDDLRRLGASVAIIGQELDESRADLTVSLPAAPADWQFVIDVIPAQLAAERLARVRGVDCDSFRVCSYVVEDDFGLMGKKSEIVKNDR